MKLDLKNNFKNIYFIGIGGVSMSGLAQILHKEGHIISGSDMKESDATLKLKSSGIKVNIGHLPENITEDIDLVVYTAAVKDDNPELMKAREMNILSVERSVLLGSIMDNYEKSIAVAGTHGKTTTSSMLSEIMLAADKNPTITIGGNLSTINGNINVGGNEYFVAEACEYHDSFLEFYPFVAVILNVEAEHLDYFKGMDHIIKSFNSFASNVDKNGYVVINSDDENCDLLIKNIECNVVKFGTDSKKADYYPEDIEYTSDGKASFNVCHNNNILGRVELNVPGKHNILNALAACAASLSSGVEINDIITGLKNYTGVDRRFQYKGEFNGVTVIDDYAHHPSEVRATLSAAKNVKHNRIWCIFQPHTYTRAKTLLSDFAVSFEDCDKVVLADIYAAREKDTGIIHSKDVADAINNHSKNAIYCGSFESIESLLKEETIKGDLVITMGAGDIYKVGENLVK